MKSNNQNTLDYKKISKQAILNIPDKVSEYQHRISPMRNTHSSAEDAMNDQTRKAAVLLLLYPKNNIYHVVLTQRQEYKGTHGGQVSLPGGKLEKSDANLLQCALRETYEEVGTLINQETIARKMKSIFIPPSNFYVQPYLSILDYEPVFTPEKREVKEILEIPLTDLNDDNIYKSEVSVINKNKIIAPYYLLKNKKVWGATGTILAELHALIDY